MKKEVISDKEWKNKLTAEQYQILREKGTESPFTGKYVNFNEKGEYACTGCGNILFDSSKKFDSACGWPSFYDAKKDAVELKEDNSLGMNRTEVICKRCGGHLGHIFKDAPDQPTGNRFCINSAGLNFRGTKK